MERPPTDNPREQELRAKLELGAAQRAAGDLGAAVATLREAFAAAEQVNDPGLRLEVGRELGLTLLAASRLAEAHELLKRMLAVTARLYGERSAEWAGAAEELALAFGARGRLDVALRLQRHALRVSRDVLGAQDPGTLLIDMNLESMTNLNRLVLPPLGTLRSAWRPGPEVARGELATYFFVLHRQPEASRRFEYTLSEARRSLELTSFRLTPYVSFFESALVRTLASSPDPEELDEGSALAKRVWDERKATLGAEHPQTLNSMLLFSRASTRREPEQALEVGLEAARTSESVLGRGHIDTLGAYEHVANMLDSHGEHGEASSLRLENTRMRAADQGIFGDEQPPIENLSGALTEKMTMGWLAAGPDEGPGGGDPDVAPERLARALYLSAEEDPGAMLEPEGEPGPGSGLVRRTAHLEIAPARPIAPGDRFDLRVHLDCEAPGGEGSGEVELRTEPGTVELELRVWLVVTRHFEIEGRPIQALELDLREPASPTLVFAVRALAMDEYLEDYEEEPAVRVLFSYLGWPSGEVRLPVPLIQTTPEPAP